MDAVYEADERLSSSFTTYLGQWFRGRPSPENFPVSPPNDPRRLQPPSQFVSLASATVHPRLTIPSIGRSNNRIFRFAASFPPNPPRCKQVIPFRSRHFLPNPPTTDLVPTLFNPTEQLCRTLPFNATGFHGAPLSRPPPLPPRRTCLIPHALLHPDVILQSRLAPVTAYPTPTTAHHLHACNHTRPNRATVLGSRISRRRSPPGDVPTDSRIANVPSIWLG